MKKYILIFFLQFWQFITKKYIDLGKIMNLASEANTNFTLIKEEFKRKRNGSEFLM